ncbi:chemotaxis protein CheX [Filobacillus milosensis]|uniref:Chemotaxis protein CheX n=1 Tax=Filobacillus milosensis TaxID=94137 RepID=A0A4Y8IKW2_9BACI|nr:chemotaxis protein CheX [Filobacillus milosensis]TFB14219.1 chemotaxis protein CheX [Filobacillus milosensis]
MSAVTQENFESVKYLLNGTISSIKKVIPMDLDVNQPSRLENHLQLEFGVLIGITGDLQGRLVLSANSQVFSSVGESMYGIPLEGEMLSSFSGELGNMIAGNISSIIHEEDINLDITAPTIMEGSTKVKGFSKALQMQVDLKDKGNMDVCLLLDQ